LAPGNKDDIIEGKKKSIKVNSVSSLNAYDKALLKFAENILVGSIETIKTFSQSMITLVSGMFAVYFAILKFLGIETTTTVTTQILAVKGIMGIPPVLFILSIIAFIVAILPWKTTISYHKAKEIESVRKTAISIKYASVMIGTGLFLISLAITILIFMTLLEP
jgi:hypothetical protein